MDGTSANSDAQLAAVHEVLDGYLDLVVELGLCPWAQPSRTNGEMRVAVEFWQRGDERDGVAALVTRLAAHARQWDDDPDMRVGLLVVPDLPLSSAAWRHVRDAVAARAPRYALADFHPEAPYQTDTPARLVSLFRRSPDPLLQLVPHQTMKALSRTPSLPTVAEQAAILANPFAVPPPPLDARERITMDNFATAKSLGFDYVAERYAQLQERRRARYRAVGIALPAASA